MRADSDGWHLPSDLRERTNMDPYGALHIDLLIRGFGVQVPGGAPRPTWPFSPRRGGPESLLGPCGTDVGPELP